MISTKLTENIRRIFEEENWRIVFWNDTEDFIASGSFSRGRDSINANASMVFIGNINQPVDTLVKTSHLLALFPEVLILCSGLLGKPVQSQMVVLGDRSLGGSIIPVENLPETLQVAFNAGAKRILVPMSSVNAISTVPGELFAKFQTSFYADPVDAVFKALGVD